MLPDVVAKFLSCTHFFHNFLDFFFFCSMLSLCPTLRFSLISTEGLICSSSRPPLNTLPLFLKKVTLSIDSNVMSSVCEKGGKVTVLHCFWQRCHLCSGVLSLLVMNYFPFCGTGSQSCRTGRVYDLMADVGGGGLFFLVHLSTGLQRLWTKLCGQTLLSTTGWRITFQTNGSSFHENRLCCGFKSAPQTGRRPCFQVVLFPPRMSRRVCWGNPKGLSQRSHLFRRPTGRPARQRCALKKLRGKISGHLLREPLGRAGAQPRDSTAPRPARLLPPGEAVMFTLRGL